jgi:hypothetical protein
MKFAHDVGPFDLMKLLIKCISSRAKPLSNDSPEKTAQSAVRGANPNGETPPGTAARAFLQ